MRNRIAYCAFVVLAIAPASIQAGGSVYTRSCDDYFKNSALSRNGTRRYTVNYAGDVYSFLGVRGADPASYTCKLTERVLNDGTAHDTLQIFASALPVLVVRMEDGSVVASGTTDVMNLIDFDLPTPMMEIPFIFTAALTRIQTVSSGVLTATDDAVLARDGFGPGDEVQTQLSVISPIRTLEIVQARTPNADEALQSLGRFITLQRVGN